MADANLLRCFFFVEKKLGHSLNQLKVQQLHKLQERLCSSSKGPNLILLNDYMHDPDHAGAQIASEHRELLCPQDRTPIPTEGGWICDQACEKEMLSLRVKCKKNKQGCNWTGEMRHYYQKHIDICPYEDVTCEDCNIRMERRFLNTHTASECDCRTVECDYCQEKLEFWGKEKYQNETCPRFPVKCSQGCGDVPREEMEFHVRDACMMTTVFCPYKEAGCTFYDKRSNLITHLEASREEHLREVWSKHSKITEQLKQREIEIEFLKKEVEKKDDEVKAIQLENACMKNRLNQLEEGTEKTRELSKRVNGLEEVQGQLEELQQETESTKREVKELEVVKNQVAELLTWKTSIQRLIEKQDEHIMKLRSSEEERETKTNSLKKLVEQQRRQNDETGIFLREELNRFRDNVVRKFEATVEKQRLNPATSPFNSTNQLSTRRVDRRTQAAFDPDNPVVKKRRKIVEWDSEKYVTGMKSFFRKQQKKTISKQMSRPTDEIMDSDEDSDEFSS